MNFSLRWIRSIVILLIVIASLLMMLATTVDAQEELPPPGIFELQVDSAPTGPPNVEELQDGRALLHLTALGSLQGDLSGTLTQHVTQIINPVSSDLTTPIATLFKIETPDGTIEGYYSGSFSWADLNPGTDATVHQYGQVLSVTGAYIDFYLAEVFYDGVVSFGATGLGTGDSATIVIASRRE